MDTAQFFVRRAFGFRPPSRGVWSRTVRKSGVRSETETEIMTDSPQSDDEMLLDPPSAGDVLRTVHGIGIVSFTFGVGFAVLGVLFAPISTGLIDPAEMIRTVSPWLIAVGIFAVLVANGIEYIRQSYRVTPIEEATEIEA